ncbi:MAG TPA: hypothetical protein IAD19_04165 [Candidatus Egerieicola faecale]|uniref:Uncharacterized protein n=1 Tax=Candidatus Egerieicola faecale TaxID=2840774 RepID=A0A9D1LIC6_9FIRM|nr:hypothetical protein [Candidatus Egerieicola faecale]
MGSKAGTAIRSLCLTQKLLIPTFAAEKHGRNFALQRPVEILPWQSLYLKISNGFPLVFAARRNAAPAFGQQSGNRNGCPWQPLYHRRTVSATGWEGRTPFSAKLQRKQAVRNNGFPFFFPQIRPSPTAT